MKIAINGFGRIGRQVLRIAVERGSPDLEIAYINDLVDAETLAHLLKHDSTYGIWNRDVKASNGAIRVGDHEVEVSSEKDPSKLPWSDRGVDVVLESTGLFRKREDAQKHRDAGAKKVLISAPAKSPVDGEFILGVNADRYDPATHDIITIGS